MREKVLTDRAVLNLKVDWHPHRGMDILSYIKTGLGRHGDSMGNRETFATPGMQWISCGSGIEHAEGGGTAAGKVTKGFQLWINVCHVLPLLPPCKYARLWAGSTRGTV